MSQTDGILMALREGGRMTLEGLAKATNLTEDQVRKRGYELVRSGRVRKAGNLYELVENVPSASRDDVAPATAQPLSDDEGYCRRLLADLGVSKAVETITRTIFSTDPTNLSHILRVLSNARAFVGPQQRRSFLFFWASYLGQELPPAIAEELEAGDVEANETGHRRDDPLRARVEELQKELAAMKERQAEERFARLENLVATLASRNPLEDYLKVQGQLAQVLPDNSESPTVQVLKDGTDKLERTLDRGLGLLERQILKAKPFVPEKGDEKDQEERAGKLADAFEQAQVSEEQTQRQRQLTQEVFGISCP
jgi:DNA-binding Lrp family transcriptional regulator